MTQRSIRRRLMGTYTLSLPPSTRARRRGKGSIEILALFAGTSVLGTILLSLPAALDGRGRLPVTEALFTAISALTATGLSIGNTGSEFSPFGEVVVLLLMELGGLGYAVVAGVVLWRLGERQGLRDKTGLLRAHYRSPTFSQSFALARLILGYALAVQAIGAAALFCAFFFAAEVPVERSAWWGMYHAASAFNLGGFSLSGQGFQAFRDEPAILVPTAFLGIAGSLGAIPILVAFRARSLRRAPLDVRLVLGGTAVLLALTTAGVLVAEWDNARTLGASDPIQRPLLAFFEASMWTGGLTAIDNGGLRDHTAFFMVGVMLIGGAAGSAAGGIKVATAGLLLFAIAATIRGRSEVTPPGRRVGSMAIRRALALVLCFVAILFVEAVALMAVSSFDFLDVLLEAASAVTTAGRPVGITAGFNDAGKAILILGMIVGRFFPLLLILEMTYPRGQSPFSLPEEGIRLG